jgi:hypothetical protein
MFSKKTPGFVKKEEEDRETLISAVAASLFPFNPK